MAEAEAEFEGRTSEDSLWSLLQEMTLEKEKEESTNQECEKQDTEEIGKCLNNDCKGGNFRVDDMDIVCTACGTVQYKRIDFGAEWRYYGFDDNKSTNPTRC